MKSWKTTLTGILSALVAVLMAIIAVFDGDPETMLDLEATIAAVIAGLSAAGFIAARDNAKSSEDVGAK